jgi:oligopeptide transport system substrate-binding protein
LRTLTAAAVVALVAAGAVTTGASPASAAGGELRVFSLEPTTLLPSDATDETSTLVIRQLYSGLVDYDPDGTPVLDLAASIETTDQTLWVIEVKPGYTFHDGTVVDANSFTQAWQQAAAGPNAELFSPIADLEADDLTLTVQLTEPMANFLALLGHTAFSPLSEHCLAEPEFCAESPIGNGPYVLDGEWEHGVGITLVRNVDYPDPGQALPDTLRYRIFPDLDAGCDAAQLGLVDVMYPIPPQCRPFGIPVDGYFEETSNTLAQLELPSYVPQLQDPQIRRALSLAIDWDAIVDTVFDGHLTLADGLVSPHFDGFRPGVCVVCVHDPDWARQQLEDAGGWPGGELALWAPAGFGHEVWLTEVGEQLEDVLGIEYRLEVGLSLPDYLARAEAGTFTGPFWFAWDPDYPAMDAYLAPQFVSTGPANYSGYASPEVDEIIDAGRATPGPAEAIDLFQEAETIIVDDLPVIPMWFEHWEAVYSATVDQFVWNLFTGPEYGLITLH